MYPSYAAKWNICFNYRNSVILFNDIILSMCGSNMRFVKWHMNMNDMNKLCHGKYLPFCIQDPTISKTVVKSSLIGILLMDVTKNQHWKSRDHQIRHQKILKSSSFFKVQRTLRHINYKICKFIQNMILPPINQCEKKTMSQLGIFVGIVQQSCNCTFTTLLKLQRSSFLFYYRAMQTMVVFLVDLCTVFLGI